jgi:hypothetical protein
MSDRGKAAWRNINQRAAQAGLTELVERLRSGDVMQTLRWFDEWWCSAKPTEEQRQVMLLVVWGGTQIPDVHLDIHKWLARFRRAGFLSDLADQAPVTSNLKVFRGAPEGSERGLSWTTSASVARAFADRSTVYGARPGLVWQAVAEREAILALIYQRDEFEVVVDPVGLRWLSEMKDA